MNYYYDLPLELQEYIESFLNEKNEKIIKLYQKMYKPYRDVNFEIRVKMRIAKLCEEEINYQKNDLIKKNEEINIIRNNQRKFFNQFNIKMRTSIPHRSKTKFDREKGDATDHIITYYTFNKQYIVISSPYEYAGCHEEHLNHNWIKYELPLYNKYATTFYKILT